MKKKLLLILILFANTLLWPYQWPIAGGYLTASFGENNLNSFLKGIRVSGHGSVVLPFLDGEIIYYSQEGDTPPSLIGNTRVLHHKNGFRSIYGHLEMDYNEILQYQVYENDQIGIVGNSGRSYEKSLFLMIYDTTLNQYVNPQIILPPSGDSSAPVISKVYILKNGKKIELNNINFISPGTVEVLAEIVDYGGNNHNSIQTVPYSISMFFLGNEINLIKFDTLKEENGELILQGGIPILFDDLYKDSLISLGELHLSSGVAYLEISTSDISMNTSNKTFQFTIE